MKKLSRAVLASALLMLGACSGGQEEPATTPAAQLSWADFAAGTVDTYYAQNPEKAVYQGLHQYDGQASDYSLEAVLEYVGWLNAVIDSANAYDNLERMEAFERDYLVQALRGERWFLAESGFIRNNPVSYANSLAFSVYVDREYAPLEQRLAAYTTYMQNVPRILEQMKENLVAPMPSPYVETAYRIFGGLSGYLEDTVPELFAGVEDEDAQARFAVANEAAIAAVRDATNWIEGQRDSASDDYALGEDGFLTMLRETQGVDITLADLKAAGAADLERNLAMLNEACAAFAPGASIKDCALRVQGNKPPEGAVAGASRQLPGLRKFLVDNDIVSIPGTEDALVAEAPPHRRFNSAYIEIPGPFESGLPSVYYIAPPDPEWSEEDQAAYIPGEADLLAISVHEVWPGHFLQFLHANRAENDIGRHFDTYTFVEGWAHYTEQMMVDAGLGDGDPEVRIGQLLNALLRNVRYMSAIGLHAEGMSVKESQRLFEEKAFQDFGNAVQQANRGTFDPGYLNYTLGKLMINKLRSDWTAGRGGREAWGQYHDQFLGYGSPPIPLIREQMLGVDYSGDEALLPD
jgi:hypothetical protein